MKTRYDQLLASLSWFTFDPPAHWSDYPCLLFNGSSQDGYGVLRHDGKKFLAHRLAYETCIGPIPDGLVLDHLCRRHECYCPAHLEAVTKGENTRRGLAPIIFTAQRRALRLRTMCTRGHLYTDDNTHFNPAGHRQCKKCLKDWSLARRRGPRKRPTHCVHGHLFDEKNTYFSKSYGTQMCRACKREHYQKTKVLKPPIPDGYITPKQYAAQHGLVCDTVNDRLQHGKLYGVRYNGRNWMIPVSIPEHSNQIADLRDRSRQEDTSQPAIHNVNVDCLQKAIPEDLGAL